MKDATLEAKLGFDKIRKTISDRCMTDYAAEKVAGEEFSTDASVIGRRLKLTDEMRLVMMFEENFPSTGYIDAIPFLSALEKPGSCIDVLSLGKLKTATDTIRRILHFFGSIKDEVYPELKRMASPVRSFPEVQRRIEGILDKYGDIKDSASDRLQEIRSAIRSKEAAISKRAGAILKQAQEAGITDADASVNIRDGKFLIPVSSSSKRKLPGFVYDESASGKTTFIEPAEIIELENDISALHFEETREIQKILYEFTEFLRPYIPELLKGAAFLGETDFLMAKAQTALDFIAGMPVISTDGSLSLRKARPAAREGPEGRRPQHGSAHHHPHPGQAHAAYLRAERGRKVRVPEDRRTAAVHVPVGHADTHLGDLRAPHIRQDISQHRRQPEP